MAKKMAQKTLRITFELDVSMEEVQATQLPAGEAEHTLADLQALQQALAQNEAALNRQLLLAALHRLQGYLDQAAGQDDLSGWEQAAQELAPRQQWHVCPPGGDFAQRTRPLQLDCLQVQLRHSRIQACLEGGREEVVWEDELLETDLGRRLARLGVPAGCPPEDTRLRTEHYLLARNLTKEADGVHFEASCTCGRRLAGLGETEGEALEMLWQAYHQHSALFDPAASWRRPWAVDWDAID